MTLTRRDLIAGVTAAAALAAVPRTGHAEAPLAGTQAPGWFRRKVGRIEVTAIADGALMLNSGVYPAADQATLAPLLTAAGRNPAALDAALNCFVVNTGARLVLVDTGIGDAKGFGLNAGRLIGNLAAAGFTPEQFDAVVLTHLHGDHIGGLAAHAARFARAEIVIAEPELAFWQDDGLLARSPDGMKPFVVAAQAVARANAARIRRVTDGAEIVPGISAVLAPGHTPGHMMLRVSDGAEQLLIWGDIVHTPAAQFARPELSISFDVDGAQAKATRLRVFDMAASDGLLVAGMHLDFPAIGRLRRETQGYSFHPAFWSPVL